MFSWVPTACGLIVGAIGGPEQDAGFDWDGGDTDVDTDSDTDTDTDVDTDSDTDSDTDTDTLPSVCDHFPGAFGLSSPTNSALAVPLTPNLQWEESVDPDLGDSVSYCVTLDNDSSFASPLIDDCDIAGTSYAVTTPLSYDTQYYWRVSAEDTCLPTSNVTPADASFSFHTVDAGVCESGPGVFDLLTPTDTAAAVSITPTLDWEDATDPDLGDTVTYRVEVDTDSSFTSPVVDVSDLPTSQYTVPTELDHSTLYYWRATAGDTCVTPNETQSASVYSFTTAGLAACTTYPSAFNLVSPPNTTTGLTTTPVLDWQDSTDPDTGDSVTYCVEVDNNPGFTSPEVNQCGLTDSQYTIPTALSTSATYYWRVTAGDTCSQITPSSSTWNFTTETSCIPYSYSDTDFTSGTLGGGAVVATGSLMLSEDASAWTYQYTGDVLPTADGWTQFGSFVSSSVSGGELYATTSGSNTTAYYERSTSFSNATGWTVEMMMRMNAQDDTSFPADAGYTLEIADGNRDLMFMLFSNRICEPLNSGACYSFDATVNHKYSAQGQGNNYMLSIDGATALNGTGISLTSTSNNLVRFGDMITDPDASFNLDYLYYYNGGPSLPYVSPGTYIGTVTNTGVVDYNHGGATISWNPTTSAGGTVAASVRAGNTADLSAVSWTDLTGNPATIPGAVTGQYMQWMVELISGSSTPVVDDVSGGRTCP